MQPESLCQYLEDLLQRLGVCVRYENLKGLGAAAEGGLCKVQGRRYLIIEKAMRLDERILVMARSLGDMDLNGMYIKPAVRDLLEVKKEEARNKRKG